MESMVGEEEDLEHQMKIESDLMGRVNETQEVESNSDHLDHSQDPPIQVRPLFPAADHKLTQALADSFNSWHKERLFLKISRDPRQWTEVNVTHWLNWAITHFGFQGMNPITFWPMNGKDICGLDKELFVAITPPLMGDILWHHLHILQKDTDQERKWLESVSSNYFDPYMSHFNHFIQQTGSAGYLLPEHKVVIEDSSGPSCSGSSTSTNGSHSTESMLTSNGFHEDLDLTGNEDQHDYGLKVQTPTHLDGSEFNPTSQMMNESKYWSQISTNNKTLNTSGQNGLIGNYAIISAYNASVRHDMNALIQYPSHDEPPLQTVHSSRPPTPSPDQLTAELSPHSNSDTPNHMTSSEHQMQSPSTQYQTHHQTLPQNQTIGEKSVFKWTALTKAGPLQLWHYLLQLLTDKDCQNIISWTGDGWEFSLIDRQEVARRWGVQKNKPKMNYQNVTQSLRYYYRKNIIRKTPGKRYVYRFVCDLQTLLGCSAEEMHAKVGLKLKKDIMK